MYATSRDGSPSFERSSPLNRYLVPSHPANPISSTAPPQPRELLQILLPSQLRFSVPSSLRMRGVTAWRIRNEVMHPTHWYNPHGILAFLAISRVNAVSERVNPD